MVPRKSFSRSKKRRYKRRSYKRRSYKKLNTKKKTKKRITQSGGSDEIPPPEGIVYKKRPTLKTWPKRYIKIEGKSLNVYELDRNLEITGPPRGSSIFDLTGVSVNVDEESFLSGLSIVKYPKLIISGGNIQGSVEIAFLPGTQFITGDNLKNSFKEAIENISAGRKWNISLDDQQKAVTKIQAKRRGINTRKSHQLETKREARLTETETMKKDNQRDYLQSQKNFSAMAEGLTPTPDFLTDLQPCSFDYSVQQCGGTCWFTSVTTFLVKNKNIRLLLGNNEERNSMHELSTWLAKLHGLHHGNILTLLGSETKCTLQTQGMCFGLPDSVKELFFLNGKIHNAREARFYKYKTLNDYWKQNGIQRIDTSGVDSDDGFFSGGAHSEYTIASMLNGLLFHKFEDGTYCVNIDLLSLSSNGSYGKPLSDKIKESMSDRALSMLILTNTANDGCALKMFDYFKGIFETSRLLDSGIIIAGGGVSVLRFEEKDILIEESHYRANDKPVNGTNKIPLWGSGHAISFKVCNGEEGVKIHISDTGIGIDYFVWWKEIDRELVMQTSSIGAKYLTVHHKYYIGMSDSCYNDYPEAAKQLSFPDRWNYNLYENSRELEWLPISLSKRFPQTVETKTRGLPYIGGLGNLNPPLLEALKPLKETLKKYGMNEEESTSLLNTYESEILESMGITEESKEDFSVVEEIIEKLKDRVKEKILETITNSENNMSEIMLTHCLGMQDTQHVILMNHSKLGEQQYFTDDEMPSLMQPFLPSYMDVKSKNEAERESMRKEANSIKGLINIEFDENSRRQIERERDMRVETLGERKERERREWDTRGNDGLKAKSEKDKKSWEILRTQPWEYGEKDDLSSEQLVSGI